MVNHIFYITLVIYKNKKESVRKLHSAKRGIPLLGDVVAAGFVVGPDGPTGFVGTVVGFRTTVKP